MKKKLPLNSSPNIRTCIHHAYPCAIIESKELAYIQVKNFDKYEWKEYLQDTDIVLDGENIKVVENDNANNTDTVLWRKVDNNDELILFIDYLKPMDFGRYVDVFIFDDDMYDQIKIEDKISGIRWNPFGLFIKKEMYSFDTKVYKFIKICKRERKFSGYVSKDGHIWEFVDERLISYLYQKDKILNIGIHFHFGRNQYNDWKYMNFIQMLYNEKNMYKGIYLDYYFFPRKNVDNGYAYYLNFLDTYYESSYEILDCFQDWHHYLHWNIDHFYYPSLCLDELYVDTRKNYSKNHYNHYNLFYGYDDELKKYYIMGYGDKSMPVISELAYDAFDKDLIKSEKVVKYKYCPNDVSLLVFNIKAVINGLSDYLNSVNSSENTCNLLTGESVIYGIDILKVLAKTETGRRTIRGDNRVSFCLIERYKIMKERLEYLYYKKYLLAVDYNRLVKKCEELIYIASNILLNILRKSYIKNGDEYVDGCLMRLYDEDKGFCGDLLCCLNLIVCGKD